ncbi:MAG: alkaline phosphatase family protein [Planctomycetota bacterium]
MKILIIGLDCAAPELLFGDDSLVNIRRLMAMGCYGRLESIVPPITVPAWMCMATGQDPGSLGVYGFRNRSDYGYSSLSIVNSKAIRELAIWDQIAREGKKSVLVGVPPAYPPRRINGVSVGCFMTPDTSETVFTHPPEMSEEIRRIVGEYPVDVNGFRTGDKDWLKGQIYEMSQKHFQVIRHLMKECEWDFFQFVEIGMDRMHHGFWKAHDPQHVLHESGDPHQNTIVEYYRYLDEEIGSLLDLIDDDTVVLVASDHGAQRLDGGFCVNEWLVREGLLVLNRYPEKITPLAELDVNWHKTTCWSEGGYYARLFLNVKGREPDGMIEQKDCLKVRDEIKARFEATKDPDGKPLGTLVFKPEEIYRRIRGIPPDLIVHFGGLYWRSIGGVGYPTLHIRENDTGPDDCNHAQFGAFILAAPNFPLAGEIEGVHMLDISPTLLDLAGYDVPDSMTGCSWVSGVSNSSEELTEDQEAIVRERLRGLGYI